MSDYSLVTMSGKDLSIPQFITQTQNLNMYARKRGSDSDLQNLVILIDSHIEEDKNRLKAAVDYITDMISD